MSSLTLYTALDAATHRSRLAQSHALLPVARESVLHMLYEQDQWLERYAGYGRVDPDYGASATATEGSVSE